MNRECYGWFFERHGKRWLRCFADSTMTAIDETPENCPACNRPFIAGEAYPKDWNPDTDTDVQIEIDLPHWKAVAEKAERTRDGYLFSVKTYRKIIKILGETEHELPKLVHELLAVNYGIRAYCSWCTSFAGQSNDEMKAHMETCADHPLATAKAEYMQLLMSISIDVERIEQAMSLFVAPSDAAIKAAVRGIKNTLNSAGITI